MIIELAGLGLLVLVAAFFLVPMFRYSTRQAAQQRWPRLRVEVLEQRLRERGGQGFPEYRVRYSLGGEEHERFVGSESPHGHRLTRSDLRELVLKKMARRPVGSTLEIRVNPADPAVAYLIEWELPARTLFYVVGALFLILFVIFAAVGFA